MHVCQLDCEHMHWKFRKLASASPTSIFKDESYSITFQAVHLKKEADCWIIVEMGKPLLSEAVGLVFCLQHATKLIKAISSHGLNSQSENWILLTKTKVERESNTRFVLTIAHRHVLMACSDCS